MSTAALYTWSELPVDTPLPRLERRRIMGERMMISRVRLEKGFAVEAHRHDNEQFAIVVSGRMRFVVGDAGDGAQREIIARAGDTLHLPSNVLHSAEALEDSLILDLFSPVSATTGVDAHRDGPGPATE